MFIVLHSRHAAEARRAPLATRARGLVALLTPHEAEPEIGLLCLMHSHQPEPWLQRLRGEPVARLTRAVAARGHRVPRRS